MLIVSSTKRNILDHISPKNFHKNNLIFKLNENLATTRDCQWKIRKHVNILDKMVTFEVRAVQKYVNLVDLAKSFPLPSFFFLFATSIYGQNRRRYSHERASQSLGVWVMGLRRPRPPSGVNRLNKYRSEVRSKKRVLIWKTRSTPLQ